MSDVLEILGEAPISLPENDVVSCPCKIPAGSKILGVSVRAQHLKRKREQRLLQRQHRTRVAARSAAQRLQRDTLRREVLKRARLQKAKNKSDREKAVAVEEKPMLERAWNSTQLSVGNFAGVDTKVKHKSQFDLHGAMALAFSNSLDKRLASTHYMAARSLVHHCAICEQKAVIKAQIVSSSAGYLFLERSYDDTPVPVAFGQLAEKIAPFAKFIVPAQKRESVGKALVNYQESTHFGVPVSQHGILDIFQMRLCFGFWARSTCSGSSSGPNNVGEVSWQCFQRSSICIGPRLVP